MKEDKKEKIRFKTWGKSRAVRLPGSNKGPGVVAVTTVVSNRRHLLTAQRDVKGALDEDLGRRSFDGHARILLACFMPDHVHLLVKLDGNGSSISQYVRQWKTKWVNRLARPDEKPFWQRSFYDHWVRSNETEELATYIAGNPVRAGFVKSWQDYPFTRWYM